MDETHLTATATPIKPLIREIPPELSGILARIAQAKVDLRHSLPDSDVRHECERRLQGAIFALEKAAGRAIETEAAQASIPPLSAPVDDCVAAGGGQ